MLKQEYPYYLANEAVYANTDLKVYDKYNGELATAVPLATPEVLDQAIAAACDAADAMAKMPMYQRQAILEHCVNRFRERFDELAYALCVEAGKPINDAKGEVTRLIDTFKIAAEETARQYG
ncbi:MAG TPA: aldehyde dehydrogenase, partial [Gammaproteobacteria bacterium]|nr:aldehyde dehydrogenase [Gammaproteobacteria bacterium]